MYLFLKRCKEVMVCAGSIRRVLVVVVSELIPILRHFNRFFVLLQFVVIVFFLLGIGPSRIGRDLVSDGRESGGNHREADPKN